MYRIEKELIIVFVILIVLFVGSFYLTHKSIEDSHN